MTRQRYAPARIVDATITTLCRAKKRTLAYTLTYADGDKTFTVKGATLHMVSAFVPYGVDVDTMPDDVQLVSIPCEYNVTNSSIFNVPLPRLTLEPSKPPPYDVLVRKAALALIAAMRGTKRSQRNVIKDVEAAMRMAVIGEAG